jgi:hypothetical protein
MADWLSKVFGQKINGVRVTPLVVKIVTIFTIFLLISNFTTNYINLMLNRGEQIRLLNQLLVKDLKELHVLGYYKTWWIEKGKGHTLRITTKSFEGVMYAPHPIYLTTAGRAIDRNNR